MRSAVSVLWTALTAAALALTTGCAMDPSEGYTTASLFPEDVETVAVPIWTRAVGIFRRELETRFTESLIKRIELDTPYKVTDKANADTILEGSIVAVSQRVLAVNVDTGEPFQREIQVAVRFTWTDLRTGEIRLTRNKLFSAGVYSDAETLNEDFFLGSTSALDMLARRVVETLQKPW